MCKCMCVRYWVLYTHGCTGSRSSLMGDHVLLEITMKSHHLCPDDAGEITRTVDRKPYQWALTAEGWLGSQLGGLLTFTVGG